MLIRKTLNTKTPTHLTPARRCPIWRWWSFHLFFCFVKTYMKKTWIKLPDAEFSCTNETNSVKKIENNYTSINKSKHNLKINSFIGQCLQSKITTSILNNISTKCYNDSMAQKSIKFLPYKFILFIWFDSWNKTNYGRIKWGYFTQVPFFNTHIACSFTSNTHMTYS